MFLSHSAVGDSMTSLGASAKGSILSAIPSSGTPTKLKGARSEVTT